MRKRSAAQTLAFLASLAGLFLASCDVQKEEERIPIVIEPGIESWPAMRKTDGGTFELTILPEGGEIVHNEHFSFELQVKAEGGSPEGLMIAADADMPGHEHGMNTKPEVSENGDGGFRVDGMLFHMFGDWVIMIDVTQDGSTERATFPVSLE